MPQAILQSYNKKYGIPLKDLEMMLKKARAEVESTYDLTDKSREFDRLSYRALKNSLINNSSEEHIFHPIIARVHDLTGIPNTILQKHWNTIAEVVKFSHGIDRGNKNFLPTVLKLYQDKINQLGPKYSDALASSFKNAIHGGKTKKVKAPTQATPPVGINPEALVYWRRIIKNQKKTINSYSENLEKWAVAIILFKTLCSKKGVSPFLDGDLSKEPTKSPITSYLSSYVNPCIEFIDKIEKFLSVKNMVGKRIPKKFKLEKVNKDGAVFVVNAVKNWKLLKSERAASVVVYMIPKFGLRKDGTRGRYKKRCGPNAAVVISYAKKNDTVLKVTLELRIRAKMWKGLKETKKDPKKFIKNWITRGFKATGANKMEAPETNEILIQEYYPAETPEDAAKLINKLTIPVIVNIGANDFQIDLAKYLIKVAEKYDMPAPSLLDRFVEDEDFREYVREEHGTRLPDDDETEGTPEGQIING
jgi:hypothetical protein